MSDNLPGYDHWRTAVPSEYDPPCEYTWRSPGEPFHHCIEPEGHGGSHICECGSKEGGPDPDAEHDRQQDREMERAMRRYEENRQDKAEGGQ
jgi:hypothetical protein